MNQPISELSAVERIARVLVAERLSINAEGYEASMALEARNYRASAIAVLKTLRVPGIVVVNAGDGEVWTRMVESALDDYAGSAMESD